MYEHRGRELWFRWVLANVVGTVGGAVGGAVAGTVVALPFLFFFGFLGIFLGPLVGGLAFIFILSWAQQIALWPYSELSWVRNSTLGGVVAIVVGIFANVAALPNALRWLPAGLLGGLIVGMAQWPVLREELSTSYARTWVWVPANAIGWAVGLMGAQVINTLVFGERGLDVPREQQFLEFLLGGVVNPLVRATIAVALAAAITGGALLLIQRQRQASVGGNAPS